MDDKNNCLIATRNLADKIVTLVESECSTDSYADLVIKNQSIVLAFHMVAGIDALQDLVAGFSLRQFPKRYRK